MLGLGTWHSAHVGMLFRPTKPEDHPYQQLLVHPLKFAILEATNRSPMFSVFGEIRHNHVRLGSLPNKRH